MVKSELISQIARKQRHIQEKDVEMCVNQLIEYLNQTLSNGDRIEVRGFGSFSLHFHPPRNAHNPKTGARVITDPKFSPHFKPGKELRDKINHAFEIEKQRQTGAEE